MKSILDEIRMLRKEDRLSINMRNTNRYRILIREKDMSDTAYYFSTPIYNQENKNLLKLRFRENGSEFLLEGSNSYITVKEQEIFFKNHEGYMSVSLGTYKYLLKENNLIAKEIEIYPTLNGIAVKAFYKGNEKISLKIDTSEPYMNVRGNTKCFSFMKEEFKPFMTLSAIGVQDMSGKVMCPAMVSWDKKNEKSCIVSLSDNVNKDKWVLFEINMYEPKLFQDTTVDSKNSNENNAFGGMGFLGSSDTFGEQWLYSRMDYGKMSEVNNMLINKVKLYVPRHNNSNVTLSGFGISRRFCSFGSTWENKVAEAEYISGSSVSQGYHNWGYHCFDLTEQTVNKRTKIIRRTEGLIIRSPDRNSGFSAVSTGDSYYSPQILEINFN